MNIKTDYVKLAVVGLVAVFCLSAQTSPSKDEVAMSKCSKEPSEQSQKRCNGKSDCGKSDCGKSDCSKSKEESSCSSSSGCKSQDQQSDATPCMKSHRKGAAQKAVEGE